jgi:hypothetical protein
MADEEIPRMSISAFLRNNTGAFFASWRICGKTIKLATLRLLRCPPT